MGTFLVARLVKNLPAQCKRYGFHPWVGKIPWRRKWQPTPVFLSGESHGHRSLVDYSPWGHKELDTTEQLSFLLLLPLVIRTYRTYFSVVSDSLQHHGLQPSRLLCPWDSPDKNTGVGCHALLQGIFPTQGSNPDLLLCRQILYHLRHWGSPRILEWVAYPFSGGSFWPRNWTRVSCIVGGFFINWSIKEVHS